MSGVQNYKEKTKGILRRAGLLDAIQFSRDIINTGFGVIKYSITGQTPSSAYQSMIRLFCQTGGISNDIISRGLSKMYPPYELSDTAGVLGNLKPSDLKLIKDEIDQNGFHRFDLKLAPEICSRLLDYALTTPLKMISDESHIKSEQSLNIFNREKPMANRYDCVPNVLVNNLDVQMILSDPSLLAMAQEYLRAKPILDNVCLWWSAASKDKPDAKAAQIYHFDMDRPKWIKFFFYITDVRKENGPHCFIQKTHRTGMVPKELLKSGYARLSDEDVAKHYSSSDFIEFTGPSGTILAEDTRGLHKGKMVNSGDRLILQVEFSNSMYGGHYERFKINNKSIPQFRKAAKKYPRTFSLFDFET